MAKIPKSLAAVVAAGAMMAPKADAASVFTNFSQVGNGVNETSTKVDVTMTNTDPGATYNSATLSISDIFGDVVTDIVDNNPSYTTANEVYNNMSITISPSGDVSNGWSSSFDANTGIATFTNNNFSYDTWTTDRDLLATIDFNSDTDYNMNGSVDTNETLFYNGTAPNAFTGYATNPGINWSADMDQLAVVPEPSSAMFLGAGLAAMLLTYRKRKE